MPTQTYIPLATKTLTSSASSVTFSSIVGTYRDLILVSNYTPSSTSTGFRLEVNSDSGSNYNFVNMGYTVSGVSSGSNTNQTFFQMIFADNVQTQSVVQVLDYSATDKHKSFLFSSGNTSTSSSFTAYLNVQAARYASTSAITSLRVFTSTGTFSTGSTFSLFGIAG